MKALSLIEKVMHLKNTVLFREVDLDLLLTIADKLNTSHFNEGETVFHVQQEGHRMYWLIHGTAQVQNKEGDFVEFIQEGDCFGDESLFSEKSREYEVVCRTNCSLLSLSRTKLLTIISECPTISLAFLQAYSAVTPFRPRLL